MPPCEAFHVKRCIAVVDMYVFVVDRRQKILDVSIPCQFLEI